MSTSTKETPRILLAQSGVAAIPMVLGLLVLVTLIGGSALKMFAVEVKQSSGVESGFRLQQLSRMGLESSFSLLRSMGAVSRLETSTTNVAGGTETQTHNISNCDYFPRTDDVKLPSSSDTNLVSTGNSVTCLTARPNHPNLSPTQDARYTSTTLTGGDIYADTNLAATTTANYRSVFPWVRYRSQSTMDDQYGASENIQTQINQCGLSSQLTTSSSSSGAPLQRYRYQQEFDGLGESWLDLGSTTMNIYSSGLTLEAWVWMDSSNAARVWQRIFDIGRGQQDGNIVLAYAGDLKKLAFELFNKGTCTDPSSSTPQNSCSNQTFHAYTGNGDGVSIPVPVNSGTVQDLWYYVGVVVEPSSTTSAKVKVYTKCERTGSTDDPGATLGVGCSEYMAEDGVTVDTSWNGMHLRRNATVGWNASTENYSHYRKTWIGKSHWLDDDFKGKMRDLRVWDKALTRDELNQPIQVNYTANTTQSSIISNTTQNNSLRISPLYKFGEDRLLYFTVKETGNNLNDTWRLVSCAWNHKTIQRKTQSLRFRILGSRRPEVIEYLPY